MVSGVGHERDGGSRRGGIDEPVVERRRWAIRCYLRAAWRRRYYLQLAVTPAQQELGLGDRAKLPPDHGMLFVYYSSGTRCFWMKGMKFALDMIWLSSADEVVSVQRDLSPKSYPSAYCSLAQDVIELDAGQAHFAGIVVNRVVKLEMPTN